MMHAVVDSLVARFRGVTRGEAWGYAVWGSMGVVVAVPEIWAAASGSGFVWPTISGTIGHLEERWAVVALVPVALIVSSAYAVARVKPGAIVVQNDQQMLVRSPLGRFISLGPATPASLEAPATVMRRIDTVPPIT